MRPDHTMGDRRKKEASKWSENLAQTSILCRSWRPFGSKILIKTNKVQGIPTGQPGCILVSTGPGQYQVLQGIGPPVSVVTCLPPSPVSARKRKYEYYEPEPDLPSKVKVLLDDSDSVKKICRD